MRAKFLYLIYLLSASGILIAQDAGLRPVEVRALKDSLQAATADNSLLKLYDAQRRLADQSLTEDPHPIDTIRTEGLLQGDPKKTATREALRDMPRIYALALVYKVSGDRKYLSALALYLTAWAATESVTTNQFALWRDYPVPPRWLLCRRILQKPRKLAKKADG